MSEIEIFNDSIQFVCDLCSLRYSTFEILMTHNRIKHYHSIRFRCGFCNEAFMNEDDLHCHFILSHRVTDPYNLESSQMVFHKKSLHQMLLSEDEKRRIMTRCDSLEDASEGSGGDSDGDSAEDELDELELNYNELFKKRKQSAMTQEEIMELADVFKKSAQGMCISKLHL